jgi:hypothetical protein
MSPARSRNGCSKHAESAAILSRRPFIGRLAGLRTSAAGLVLGGGCTLDGSPPPPKSIRVGVLAVDSIPTAWWNIFRMRLRELTWTEGAEPHVRSSLRRRTIRAAVNERIGAAEEGVGERWIEDASTPALNDGYRRGRAADGLEHDRREGQRCHARGQGNCLAVDAIPRAAHAPAFEDMQQRHFD